MSYVLIIFFIISYSCLLYITYYVYRADMKLKEHRNNPYFSDIQFHKLPIFYRTNIWGEVDTPVKQGQAHISLSKPLSYAYLHSEEPVWSVCFLNYLYSDIPTCSTVVSTTDTSSCQYGLERKKWPPPHSPLHPAY